MRNKFGLSRDIPAGIKRAVRQRCGFGCVICAGAIFEYEHFNPEFAQAHGHWADGITLLCPNCHAKKTRNLLSDRRVREANAVPAAHSMRYAYSDIEGASMRPFVQLAGMTLKNCETPLQMSGLPVLRIEDAEDAGGPYRLSASFFNAHGAPSLFIRQNEWQVLSDSWDVEVVGASITVRTGPGDIALRLVFKPGEGLVVDRLEMSCGGYRLSGNATDLQIRLPGGGQYSFRGGISDNCKVGLALG
jgi:hypothetical protein